MAGEVLCNGKTWHKYEDQLIADNHVRKVRRRLGVCTWTQVLWVAFDTTCPEGQGRFPDEGARMERGHLERAFEASET